MTIKVFIYQRPDTIPPDSGIGRVVHAQYKYLPMYGIELTTDYKKADVITSHTDIFDLPRVDLVYCHGLYWNGDPDSGQYNHSHHETNRKIISAIRKSLAVTVPSDWVGECFRRDMRLSPFVIPHGIDLEQWRPGGMGDYILWGKNRGGDVCDATPAWELANRGYEVVSTFSPANYPVPSRMAVTGRIPETEMRDLLMGAYIYLATTKETFGIQTLEAMACGAPVLGFDWGGTRDIVTHKVDGYLVPPYDYKALEEGAEYIHQHRQEMSQAARAKASQYTWDKAMKLYANAFQSVQGMLTWEKQNSGVAVVITSYNYAHYLGEALWSISNQSLKPSEVIVVDDASTDDTTVVAEDYRQRFEVEGVRYKVITHQTNQGVASARNHGVESAVSPYVVCLDADDRLHPLYLKACRDAFLKDRGLGIVYSGLGIIQPDGKVYENVWTGKFDWEFQADVGVPPHTTIPTAAMFRKEMWKRAGGYRQRYAPGEDAEFYTRGLSLGFTAQKVTDSPLIEYRIHGQGAHQTRRYIRIDDDKPWMRDHLYPLAAPSTRAPLVRSYSSPLVAVHINMLPDEKGVKWVDETGLFATLESLVGQSWREWEVVITEPIKMTTHAQYPFIHLKHTAPLCIRVNQGTILPNDFLITELTRYVSLSENQEWDGGESMGRCCGGAIDPKQMAQLQMLKQGNMKPLDPSGRSDVSQTVTTEGQLIMRGDFVRMEYIGDKTGATTIFGKAGSNRQYRAGNNPTEKYIDVHKEDVEKLQNTGDFRLVRINREVRVESKPEPEPTPQVSAPVDTGVYAPLRDSRIPFGERRDSVEGEARVGVEKEKGVENAGDTGNNRSDSPSDSGTPVSSVPHGLPRLRDSGQREELASYAEGTRTKDSGGQGSNPQEVIPDRFKAREIPPEALGDLSDDTPIAPVEPTPEPPPLPPSPMVSDTSWPTQENETVLKQRAMRRDIKLGP